MKRYTALMIGCLLLAGCQNAPAAPAPESETVAASESVIVTEQTVSASSEPQAETSAEDITAEEGSAMSNEFLDNLNDQMAGIRAMTEAADPAETAAEDTQETTGETAVSVTAGSTVGEQATEKRGDPDYGYVIVPTDWVQAEQDPGIAIPYLEYDDPEGTCEIVMFSRENYYSQLAADNIYDDYESREGHTIIGSSKATICGCTSYRIDIHIDDQNRTLIVWVFQDDDLITHFINIECPDDKTDDMLKIASTYSFT